MIAKVIINSPSSNIDQLFDYLIPSEFCDFASVGSRVRVPFGEANRQIMGFIMEIKNDSSYDGNLKEIIEVVDYEPVLTKEQLEIATFIKADAICPLSRILNLMIPDALKLKTKKYLTVVDFRSLNAELVKLFDQNETILYKPTLKTYDGRIAKEVKKGNILVSYETPQVIKEKKITKYVLNPSYTYANFNKLKSDLQKDFLERLKDDVARTSFELIEKYDVSLAMIISLAKKGYLDKMEENASRIKIRNIPVEKRIRKTDNPIIGKLIQTINNYEKPILYIPKDENQLLECLLQVINSNQKNNKNTIVIVPEILSSYKIENLIRKNTLLSVALINSRLSKGELLDYYNEIKKDNYAVIVTTAKGALLPYQNVGTYFLLDSESDNYYNDQSPRYDLHKVIEYASKITNSQVIRVSYVPTILEYTYGLKGYLDIIEDFDKNIDVKVEIIDLKKELQIGNNSSISTKLLKMLQINKAKGKKSLLIINNRDYSSYVICRTCGNIIKCPRCQISLQYNKKHNQLICPACSYRTPYQKNCSICNSTELRFGGIGIEQVEEDLRENLSAFKITSLVTNDFENFCNIEIDFEDGDIDILLTTNLFSKSILGKKIGLICFVNIDAMAKAADYDATYRAYSALMQAKMKLININDATIAIQTYHPNDDYLKDFLVGEYHTYVKNELVVRKILKNEPFYYINRILVKGKYEEIFQESYNIKQLLQSTYGKRVFIMGPTYNYQYLAAQLIIKHKINDISDYYQKIYQNYQSSNVIVIFDKYPKYI